jgi:hypothetical protein
MLGFLEGVALQTPAPMSEGPAVWAECRCYHRLCLGLACLPPGCRWPEQHAASLPEGRRAIVMGEVRTATLHSNITM